MKHDVIIALDFPSAQDVYAFLDQFKDEKPFIIGTGGFARIFEEYSLFDEVSPELVLLGVKKALEMNS